MRPCSPEAGNRRAHRRIVLAGVGVCVAGVGNLALGGGVDAVDLGLGEGLEVLNTKLVGQGAHAGVLEELVACVVDGGGGRVVLEDALAGELLGEVLARVEVFEEAAYSLNVLVRKLD